jgi:GNAT superfamily N-acetyltransferase
MQVRPARLEDAERIAEIHVRSWQGGYQGLIPQEYLDGLDPAQRLPFRIEWLTRADWSRGGCLVVAGDDGVLAGFADVAGTRDADAASADTGEVRAIYLMPEAWGNGFGRALMAASLRHLTECGYDQVTLWVLASNARARRFYAAAGFRPDGAEKVDERPGFRLEEVRYWRPLP